MNKTVLLTQTRNTLLAATRSVLTMPRSPDPSRRRGIFIVLEGCDRSGKSSQSLKLYENLTQQGYSCQRLSFPDRTTPIGKMINSYLQQESNLDDHSIHLLFSANRWEHKNFIVSQLEKGTTLVVDRYAYSGVAFSAAKQTLDFEWCKQADVGLPQPDVVFFLDISPEKASLRQEFGSERYENLKFQSEVYEKYLKLKESYWQIIDAECNFDAVQDELLKRSKEILDSSIREPVKCLWTKKELAKYS